MGQHFFAALLESPCCVSKRMVPFLHGGEVSLSRDSPKLLNYHLGVFFEHAEHDNSIEPVVLETSTVDALK